MDQTLDQLRRDAAMRLVDAQLVGANPSGIKIADCSLLGADLAGANLSGAHLLRVDLRLANLREATLTGATLEMVTATGAILRGAHADRVRMHHVELLDADLQGADIRRAMLNTCTLDRASLEDCDLTGAYVVYSKCVGVRFGRARLERLTALGSTFHDAQFEGARGFFTCNEIVAEVLLREAAGDLQRIMECAAIVADRERCYTEWRDYVERHPDAKEFAFRVFERYPESGCAEALSEGWGRCRKSR